MHKNKMALYDKVWY